MRDKLRCIVASKTSLTVVLRCEKESTSMEFSFTIDETIEGSHHTFTVKVEKEHSRQQYVKQACQLK